MKTIRTEKEFSRWLVAQLRKHFNTVFSIETEETVKGFPDIMIMPTLNKTVFMELKVGLKDIQLQHTQLAFAKRHKEMSIGLCIFNQDTGSIYFLPDIKRLEEIKPAKVTDKKVWYSLIDLVDYYTGETGDALEILINFCRSV